MSYKNLLLNRYDANHKAYYYINNKPGGRTLHRFALGFI